MNNSSEIILVTDGCKNVTQGDVISLESIYFESENGCPERHPTPSGVVVISQTCDIIQSSKTRLLVAPMITAAKKGRKPLHLYIKTSISELIADLELTVSIPKARLVSKKIIAHPLNDNNIREIAQFANRLGRVYTRHPFPDEIPPVFSKLRERVQSKVDGQGNF